MKAFGKYCRGAGKSIETGQPVLYETLLEPGNFNYLHVASVMRRRDLDSSGSRGRVLAPMCACTERGNRCRFAH